MQGMRAISALAEHCGKKGHQAQFHLVKVTVLVEHYYARVIWEAIEISLDHRAVNSYVGHLQYSPENQFLG